MENEKDMQNEKIRNTGIKKLIIGEKVEREGDRRRHGEDKDETK